MQEKNNAALNTLARNASEAVGALAAALRNPNGNLPGTDPGNGFKNEVFIATEGVLTSVAVRPDDLSVLLEVQTSDPGSTPEDAGSESNGESAGSEAVSNEQALTAWSLKLDEHLSAQMLVLAHAREAICHGKRVRLEGYHEVGGGEPAEVKSISILA